MKRLRNFSAKIKQILVIWLGLCCAVVLACVGLAGYEVMTSRAAFRERLQTIAEWVGVSAGSALERHDDAVAADILSTLCSGGDVVAGCLCTADGNILARFHREHELFAFPPPRPDGLSFEHGHFLVYQRIAYKGKPVGVIYLQSVQVIAQGLRRYTGIAAVLVVGGLLFTLVLSTSLQRIISGRILDLARAARSVARSRDYGLRVPNQTHDEFGGLVDDFNDMLGQIQAQDAALQQAHSLLEERVDQRTQELKAEIAERRRAEELLREQVERITFVNQLTCAVVQRADLANVFHVLLGHLEERLAIHFGAAYTFAAHPQGFVVAAHGPKSGAVATAAGERIGDTLSVSESFLRRAQQGDIFQLLPDPELAQAGVGRQLARAGVKFAVVVPLQAEAELLGALILGRCANREFSQSEGDFLRILSDHVALAARQTQLYSQLQTAYKELYATQQAALQQERLRALGQMASGIAHDINNALTPVMGFADLLDRSEPNLSARGRRCLEMIKTAAEDITITVGRMREFYRQRTGDEPLATVELNKAVQQAIDLTRPRWRDIPQQRGIIIDLRVDLDPALTVVLGNESDIRQALVNLIINAVDALPKGGVLTLRTRSLTGRLVSPGLSTGHAAQVEVIDTGVGMDNETRRRCLEPFFSTKGARGTGLGLAMVYGVMERHGGRIEIDSAPGKGTTMRLLFPTDAPARAESIAKTEEFSETGPLRVLCIDDEPLVLEVMEGLLDRLGHQTQTAAGGTQALNLFRAAAERRQAFDVVITDLGMPGMDGRTLAAQLKTESPSTPIILLTGWGMFLNGEERLPSVVDQVLAKPPSISDVQRGLLTVTRGRQASRPKSPAAH